MSQVLSLKKFHASELQTIGTIGTCDSFAMFIIPFFTTKASFKSGTGIGMYIVKRMIVENHKGKIWFESKHMKGTNIVIELPNL